jgi:hypothetical protein
LNFNFKPPIVHLCSAGFNQKIPPILCSNIGTKKSARSLTSDAARSVLTSMASPLISKPIATFGQVPDSLIEPFLDVYLVNTRTAGTYYSPRIVARGVLKLLFRYLVEIKAVKPPKLAQSKKPYDWLLNPYLRHLQDECGFSAVTLQRARAQVGSFLDAL